MSMTIALIQARLRSTRLPGKVLMALEGMSLLELMLKRLARSKKLDSIAIVTSLEPENEAIAYVCKQLDIPCYKGSETDVLDRYYQAAIHYGAEHIVRLTADCPLIDADIVDGVIGKYHSSNADIAFSKNFPDGQCVGVFSFKALKAAWECAKLPSEREHVVPWIRKQSNEENQNTFKCVYYTCENDLFCERWTIDEAVDYIFFRELVKALPMSIVDASWKDILNTIRSHPEISRINKHICPDEGYQKSLEEDKKICL